ncbi:MAG: oligosaccharide flippase family protein [Candidatus Aenigmarchaeota archaeon]|nr:oligosaccharide flippase family protein [Candidatus Aenigmarchaeota archaeon]
MNGVKFLFNEFKKEKELIGNSLLMFIANGVPAIIIFLVNLTLARIFSPESFGNFRTVIYLVSFFSALIDFGAGVTLTKYIAQFKVKDKEKIGYMTRWFLKLRLISYSILFLLLFILIKPIAIHFLHDESLSYLVIFGFSLIIANFFGILPSMVMGHENFKLYLTIRLIGSFGSMILGMGLGYFFGVPYAILGFAISNLLGNLICLRFLFKEQTFKKMDGIFDIKKIFFKFSLPMYVFSLPNSLGNAIVPILSIFFSMEMIGQYSFSFLFYVAGLVIPGTLSSVLLPTISRLNVQKNNKRIKETLLKVFLVYTIIVIGGISGTLLLGETIISIIAPQYLPGLLFFKVLVSLGLLVGYLVIYQSYLTAKEKVKQVALMVVIQNLLLFIISFILLKSV